MLARLRRRLTGFAALLTGSVVALVAALSFLICAKLYTDQCATAFKAAVQDLAGQWNYSSSVDLNQLQTVARAKGMNLYFAENGKPLVISKLQDANDESKELLKHLETEGFAPDKAPFLKQKELFFESSVQLNGQTVRLTAQKQRTEQGWRLLAAWQALAPERQVLCWAAAGFGLVALAGVALSALLCWVIAGRAIRPVQTAMKEQKEFVRAAGHELRTPLGVFRAGLAILPQEDTASAKRHIQLLDAEAMRMSRLIDNLLTLSGGGMLKTSTPQVVQPDTLLLDLAENWEPAVRRRGLRLRCKLPEEILPDVRVHKEELCQILSVFLDNAMQYAPAASEIEMECSLQNHRVVWSVADHGQGVPDEQKEAVFKRFWRAEQSRSDRSHFGLGLSVAAELAEHSNMYLFVKDTPGGGACFCVECAKTR